MKIHAELHQIREETAFLNFFNDSLYCLGVGVWGSAYRCPTVVLRAGDGTEVAFIQFNDEECMKEFMENNPGYEIVLRLDNPEKG